MSDLPTPSQARADLDVVGQVEQRYENRGAPQWIRLLFSITFGLAIASVTAGMAPIPLLVALALGIAASVLDARLGQPRGTRRRATEQPTGLRRVLTWSHVLWCLIAVMLMDRDLPLVLVVGVGVLAAVHGWFCRGCSRVRDADA